MGLFKVEEGLLVLDKQEIRGIKEFHEILTRDKGSDGDSDGRKKLMAFKEFYYIWYMMDLESPGNKAGYNTETLNASSKKEARLPLEWKADKLIGQACLKYKEIYIEVIPELVLLNSSLRGMVISAKITNRLADNLEKIYDTYERQLKTNETEGKALDLEEDMKSIQAISSHINEMMKMAAKIPEMVQTLEKNKQHVIKVKSGSGLIRGDHTKGNRADPIIN